MDDAQLDRQREAIRLYNREYYLRKRDKILARAKAKRAASPKQVKQASREYHRRRYRRKPEKARENRWRRRGILLSWSEYQDLLTRQGGVCAINPAHTGKLVVDHCHKTGRIRGILCDHCNRALGFFRDDPTTLVRAAVYLVRL